MNKSKCRIPLLVLLALFSTPLLAHPLHNEVATFSNGLLHPMGDWGHVLSVLAIGFWAGTRKTRNVSLEVISWLVIGVFLTVNGALHATAVTPLTGTYAVGLVMGTSLLLAAGLFISGVIGFVRDWQQPATNRR